MIKASRQHSKENRRQPTDDLSETKQLHFYYITLVVILSRVFGGFLLIMGDFS